MVCSIVPFDLYCTIWFVLHHLICIKPLLEVNCTIGVVLRQCFSILFEFQVIMQERLYLFHLFCHLSFYFFAPAAFILELYRFSKGRSISRVQTENCYYFRNGFCFSLWVSCRVGYCHCHLKCVLRSISRVQTENCTIDKQSPYVKLLLFSKRVLLVIVSETVEWAIALSEDVEWAITRKCYSTIF